MAILGLMTMTFWRNLFSRGASAPLDYTDLFLERVRAHRTRMTTAGPIYRAFLEQHLSDEILNLLAPMAAEKMARTASDGEEHSVMLAKSPVCYVLWTVPVAIQGGAGWFERKYGGYTKVLEHCWNSDVYRSAGSEVLCHITYGHARRDTWVNVTLFPIGGTRFSFQPVLAIDLLSPAERRMSGVQ